MLKMILEIDPAKSAITSIISAFTGTVVADLTLDTTNIAFQHAAWSVAIVAGLVSIVNGIIKIIDWAKKRNKKPDLNELE
jgi:hypothetical protein